MPITIGVNLRNTVGFISGGSTVNDGGHTNYTVDISAVIDYPVSYGGTTIGWEDNNGGTADQNASIDFRLAGAVTVGVTTARFRIDLPQTGTYGIQVALGDNLFDRPGQQLLIQDNTSTLPGGTLTGSPLANQFIGADNILYTSDVNWVAANAIGGGGVAQTNFNFTSTIARFVLGDGANVGTLAHIFITGPFSPFTTSVGGLSPGHFDSRSSQLRTWTGAGITGAAVTNQARAPYFSVPHARHYDRLQTNRGFEVHTPLTLLGRDQQFAGPGQWKTYDYPNPPGNARPYPSDLRSFVNQTPIKLVGRDTQFRGPGQWQTYDYPNPLDPNLHRGTRGPYPVDLRTYVGRGGYNLNLIGQDAFPKGKNSTDTPAQPIYPVSLRTLIGKSIGSGAEPVGQQIFDTPAQQRPVPPTYTQNVSVILKSSLQVPNGSQTFDTPTAPVYPPTLRTHIGSSIGAGAMPVGDQSFDKRWQYDRIDETQTLNLLESTLSATTPAVMPQGRQSTDLPPRAPQQQVDAHNHIDQSLPYITSTYVLRGPIFTKRFEIPYPNDLRTWINQAPQQALMPLTFITYVPDASAYDVSLRTSISKQIGGGAQPVGQQLYDKPIQEGNRQPYPVSLRTWVEAPLVPPAPVGEQIFDRSLGSRPEYSNLLRFWSDSPSAPTVFPYGKQFYDLARGTIYPSDLRTFVGRYTLELIGQDAFPPGDQSYAGPPLGSRPEYPNQLRTYNWFNLVITPSGVPVGGSIYDLARGTIYPNDLRTFVGRYLLELIGQDAFPTGDQSFATPAQLPIIDRFWSLFNANTQTPVVVPVGEQTFSLAAQLPLFDRTWISFFQPTPTAPIGENIFDLPPRVLADIKTWIQMLVQNPTQPVGDQSFALSAQPPIDIKTWLQSAIQTATLPTGGQSFGLSVPTPSDVKTWIQSLVQALSLPIGEQNVGLPAQRTELARQWTFNGTLLVPAPVPSNSSTDRPIIVPFPNDLRTWLQTIRRPEVPPAGKNIYDLPIPPIYHVQFRTWIGFRYLGLVDQKPFYYDYPNPVYPPRPLFDFVLRPNPNLYHPTIFPGLGYGLLVPRQQYGLLVPHLVHGIIVQPGFGLMPVLGPMPAVMPRQIQTMWIDFGRFLPAGTMLTGIPDLELDAEYGTDTDPNSRISGPAVVGTISQALGGTGLTNTSIIWQVSGCIGGATYIVDVECPRTDGDAVEASTRFNCQVPN